jgi:hypothetical protein
MDDKARHGFETARFSYAEIEQALAAAFGVSPDVRERQFRARLKHFSRLGVPSNKPGKGSRLLYSLEDAAKWLLMLMGAEIGIEPVAMARVIDRHWQQYLAPIMRMAINDESRVGMVVDGDMLPPNPLFLTIRPRVVSGDWGGEIEPKWIGGLRRYTYRAKLADRRRHDNFTDLLKQDDDGWVAVRNLTEALSKIEEALK